MSADVVSGIPGDASSPHREEQLADVAGGDAKSTAAVIGSALGELDRAMAAHVDRAKGDLREAILLSFGPDATGGNIDGARKMLELMLEALPAQGGG
jgi:hypothetical protein